MRRFGRTVLLAVACATLSAGRASAAIIFSDNFDTNARALNTAPAGWTVTDGTVDIVGLGSFDSLCAGSPSPIACIDMDGSTSHAGTMNENPLLGLLPGQTYTFSFWASGSQRGDTNTLHAGILAPSPIEELALTLPSDSPWAPYSFNVSVGSPTSVQLYFKNDGGDNIGILIDNVVVRSNDQAVPEPMSLSLLGSGLAGIVAVRRRRNGRA